MYVRTSGSSAKYTYTGPVDLYTPSNPILVPRKTVGEQMRASYTFAAYVNIGAAVDIRAVAPLLEWPGVWQVSYSPAKEELHWTFIGETVIQNGAPTQTPRESVIIPKVPLQRWNQVVIAFEGRTADFYVNGQLIKSHTLEYLPPATLTSAVIVNKENFMGQLAYVEVWPRRLTVSEAASNYLDTSDSQGRPYYESSLRSMFDALKQQKLFGPTTGCSQATPTADKTQAWEFPYA
jgi:hypothetical protein